MTVAVLGSTGKLGGRVARLLDEAGISQRLLVRDPTRVPVQAPVFEIKGYDDDAAVRAGLDGATTLLFIPAGEEGSRVDVHRSVVDSAMEAGIEHIVYFSFAGASPTCTFLLGRDHWATEQMIRESGIAFTFLRMNFYLDVIPGWAGEGEIRGPAGDGKVAACSRDDMAATADAVLADPASHLGKTYELTGREAFSFAEAAATMSELSGKTITYVNETMDEARASRAKYGAEDWMVDAWISTYTAVAAGELATITDDVERLTGSAPQTLTEFLDGFDWPAGG